MARLSRAHGVDSASTWVQVANFGELHLPEDQSILLSLVRLERLDEEDRRTLLRFLNSKEQNRCESFKVSGARSRFLVARALVRCVLGKALDCLPREVPITTGEHGKPALDGIRNMKRIEFNISHSEDLVLAGFALHTTLGVDIEQVRDRTLLDEITRKHFHPDEQYLVLGENGETDVTMFYRIWSLKEAVVKAMGIGIGYPTSSFSVAPALHHEGSTPLEIAGTVWHCRQLRVAKGYASALALA